MAISNFFQVLRSQLYYTGADVYNGWKNPSWLLMRNIARFDAVRSLAGLPIASPSRSYSFDGTTASLVAEVNVNDAVDHLQKDGFHLGLQLSPETLQEVVSFAKQSPLCGNRNNKRRFFLSDKEKAEERYGERFHVADAKNTETDCPAIQKLQCDPQLLAIAARYLCANPVHQGNQLWWSFGQQKDETEPTRRSHLFHYDLDDFNFIKIYFYLTDVDPSNGPHVVVPGSHKRKRLSHKWLRRPRPDQDIIDIYGADSITTICEKRGFGFVEDGFTIHKGEPPAYGDRLILTISYATRDYGMHRDHMPTS